MDQKHDPVMVTPEYDIDSQDAAASRVVMVGVRAVRRRSGAVFWGLVQDSGDHHP